MAAATMERNWTTIGAEFVELLGREAVEAEIEALDWIKAPKGSDTVSVGMMPGMGINECIKEFRIPKVSRIAISSFDRPGRNGDEDGFYPGFYAIEGTYANGRAILYVLDTGAGITPLCSDFFPKE